jgi:hypothetical protein
VPRKIDDPTRFCLGYRPLAVEEKVLREFIQSANKEIGCLEAKLKRELEGLAELKRELEGLAELKRELEGLEAVGEGVQTFIADAHEDLLKLLSQYHAMRHLCSSHPNGTEEASIYVEKTEELYSQLFKSEMLYKRTGPELAKTPVVYVMTAHPDLTSFWGLLFRKELAKKTDYGKMPLIFPEKPIFEKGISSFIAQQGTQGAVGAEGAEGAEGA